MQLKNKAEREKFLENYKSWGIWKEVPELELKFYRYEFPNGTVLIATENESMKFANYRLGHFEYEKSTDVKYSLILSIEDKFNAGYSNTAHKLYNPSGDNKTSIIEYLTKTRPEVTN